MNETIQDQLNKLCTAETTEQEISALRSLNIFLANTNIRHVDPEAIEKEFLFQSKTTLEEGNPYPLFQVTDFCFPDSIMLRDFVHYLLTRRYGWSEMMPHGSTIKVQRIHGVGSSSGKEAVMKAQLNELLDEFIKWLLCQQLSHELISSLKYCVHQAANHPVIRKQTFIHILEWFHSKCTVFHKEYFSQSKELILLGLTDVWSAIRSACASKLNVIVEQFDLTQLEDFFQSLVQACRSNESNWQAKEGAVMGLNAIIRRFQWVGFKHDETETSRFPSNELSTEFFLKFGREELQKMPEFISVQLNMVIYILLADPQLSIREQAIKTFSSYLSRCEFQEALSSFKEVVTRLCLGTGLTVEEMVELDNSTKSIQITIQNMDAYLAEGLLGMCIFLVKHIAMECLMSVWSLSINTLSFYLMHSASTVRQATSKVIKFIVAKDTSNPKTLKSVLSSLSSFWNIDMELLLKECLPENSAGLPDSLHIYRSEHRVKNQSVSVTLSRAQQTDTFVQWKSVALNLADTWEWREGRMLAYELVFQFLIKNHWLYTFGASNSSKSTSNDLNTENNAKMAVRPQQTYGGLMLQNSKAECNKLLINGTHNKSLNLKDLKERPKSSLPSSPREMPLTRPSHLTQQRVMSPRLHAKIGKSLSHKRLDLSSLSRDKHPRHSTRLDVPSKLGMMNHSVPLKRRATLDHVNVASLTTLVKHYSYYENSKTSPHKDGYSIQKVSALPLITAIKYVESPPSSSGDQSPRILESEHEMAEQSDGLGISHITLKKPLHESMTSILTRILYQTIECINSSSWELRRMSQQVLPCLVEIIRWYDMTILEEFWTQYLTVNTNVISYGAALSFLHSITHANKLAPMLNDPPETWQNIEMCKAAVRNIVDSMKRQLENYVPICVKILKRPTIDRLTVITIQILMTCVTFSRTYTDIQPDMNSESVKEVIECIQFIASATNPSTVKKIKIKPRSEATVLLPGSGFLSCSPLDSEQISSTLEHTERYLIEQIQGLLIDFIRYENIQNSCLLLPALVTFLRKQISSDSVLKTLNECIIITLDQLSVYDSTVLESKDRLKLIADIKRDCFFGLLLCLTDQPTKHIIHAGLDCLSALLNHQDSTKFILPLLKTICNKNSYKQEPHSHSKLSTNNLEILSNDIRESDETAAGDDSESDDERDLNESDHMESLILHNSGGTASGRQSSMSQHSVGDGIASHHSQQSDEDNGSDWDSWDESEEDSSDSEVMYREFLQKLYSTFVLQGRISEFTKSLNKLSVKEQQIIKGMLDPSLKL